MLFEEFLFGDSATGSVFTSCLPARDEFLISDCRSQYQQRPAGCYVSALLLLVLLVADTLAADSADLPFPDEVGPLFAK